MRLEVTWEFEKLDTLLSGIITVLQKYPHSNKREIRNRLREISIETDTSTINSKLYGYLQIFERVEVPMESAPRWSLRWTTVAEAKAPVNQPTPQTFVETPSAYDLPNLYEWQKRALDAWQKSDKCGIIEAVTGSGKTLVGIAALLSHLDTHAGLVIVPSTILLHQWAHALEGVRCKQVERLGDGYRGNLKVGSVLVATVQSASTLRINHNTSLRTLLVADECHRYGAPTWASVLDSRYPMRLGLTATLERLDDGVEEIINPYFGGIVYSLDYEEASKDGIICPFEVTCIGIKMSPSRAYNYYELERQGRDLIGRICRKHSIDFDRTSFGEFITKVSKLADPPDPCTLCWKYLKVFNDKRELLADAEEKINTMLRMKIATSPRTIIFTDYVQAAQRANMILRGMGVQSCEISSCTSKQERAETLRRFQLGQLSAIIAPRILDEGVNLPDANVAIIVSASRSRRQMIQRLGRVLRRGENKKAHLYFLYFRDTSEDPELGNHEGFIDMVEDVAQPFRILYSD